MRPRASRTKSSSQSHLSNMNPYGYDRRDYRPNQNETPEDPLEGIDLLSRIIYQFNLNSEYTFSSNSVF